MRNSSATLRYLIGAPVKYFALILLFTTYLCGGRAFGQTDPVAQALPYTQNFSTLTGSTTTYPAGFQGWAVPGSLTSVALTAAPSGNLPLFAGQTNATTTPFVGDMWGKIGILSGSSVNALCLALNTTSVSAGNVQLIYTAATQGQTAGGYVDELDLQYRVGTSGAFTTIANATYRNNALTTTNTAITTAVNPATVYVVLPAACTNQPVVELRWISRTVSGSGTVHPGFSISNVVAQQNTTTEYYSKSAGNLDALSTWGANADGSGAAPASFTADGQVFHISNGTPGTLGSSWAVSGAGSKIVVDGTDFTNTTSNTITATIDVNAGRTLTLQNATIPTLGAMSLYSTVVFSNLTGVTIPTVTPSYGSITFNNSTVTLPTANQKVHFSGNFTLLGTSVFNGADATKGYSLTAYGNNAQVINANSLPLTLWNLDVGSTNLKTAGPVTLAASTTITTQNSVLMVLSGSTPLFNDGGNTINVINNFDCGGAASAYNFTGTVSLNSTGGGSCNIRGNGVPSNPCVAAVNNLVLNNAINVKINPAIGGSTFVVKGNLTYSATAVGHFNSQDNNISIGGNFNYANSDNTLLSTGAGALIFNGAGVQTYSSSVTGGNTLSNLTMANTGAGLVLNAPLTITGNVTLNNGIIATGTYSLSIAASGTVSGGNSASYVNGNLVKAMPAAGTTSMFYETGDVNSYAPIQLTFSSIINSGSIAASAKPGSHPSLSASYVNASNFVNRYWTITSTSVNPATVNIALGYNSADITSGLGLNTGYTIREFTGGSWSTLPSVANTTSAAAPMLPFSSFSTGVNGSTFSGDYVAGAFDCTTSAGTTTGTPAFLCGSGTTTLSLAGATTNTGNSYQWQSSADGSLWTNITAATGATYTTSVVATSIYYRNIVGCIPTLTTLNSATALVSVNPLPASISGITSGCIGLSATLSDATGAGTWSSSNTSVATIGSSGTYNSLASGNATITFTAAGAGCIATTQLTINPTPPAPVVSPLLVSLCPGSPARLISASGDTAVLSFAGNSGGISIPIPYNTAITSTIPVSGIPAGAIITNVAVTFSDSNSSGSQGRDFVYNLGAPNGNILNLINATGGSAPNYHFRNIQVGSAGTVVQGTTQLVPGVLYSASLVNGVPSTAGFTTPALRSNVTSWSSLYSTPNGNWTFIADNIYAFGAGEGTLANWILNISYIVPPVVTWTPASGLFTDAGAITPYSGANTGSVYAKPALTTTYNVIAAIGACTNTATVVAQQNPVLYLPPISGPSVLCFGSNINLTDSVDGGVWSSSGSASIGSASGIVIGTSVGSAIITYTYSNGVCSGSVTKVISVDALPAVSPITGTANLCYSGAPVITSLTDATAGGAWSSGNTAVASVVGSTGVVTGISVGSSIITYTFNDGNCSATVNATVNVFNQPSAVSASPTFAYVCGGSAPQIFTASGGLIPGRTMAASGPISVLCTTITPTATTLDVSGVPADATVTGIAVTFNVNCSYDGDAELNLAAPNGSVINLFSAGTGNSGVNFVNTTISSAGVTAIPNSAAGAPWTGTYAASARTNAALTRPFSSYSVTTTSWSPLKASNPNGTWSLVGLDNYKDSTFTITSWSISISYNYQANVTWAGVGGLYTNSAGTLTYTGSTTDTVYSAPASTTIYTVSSTNGTCSSTANVTMSINPAPAPISGILAVCLGSNTQLTDAGGGTWSTASPNISIGSSDGLVTSVSLGTAVVTYTSVTGCAITAVVTVNAAPNAISGTLTVCQLRATSLADAGGGTWSSSNPGNASVGSAGLVTGVTGGTTAVITYALPTGCFTTAVVTVNVAPSAITGTRTVCVGATTCLSDAVAGGTWSSNNGNVTVGSTGCITGAVAGTAILTYKLPTGCVSTIITTANPVPGNITGVLVACQGTTTQLTDAGAGTWSSSNTAVATVAAGLVSGVAAGTSNISFSFSTGCAAVKVVTINPLPGTIGGNLSLCLGSASQLTDADAGGTWVSSNGNVTIGSTGLATSAVPGTSTITYTLPTSCATITTVTINANPGNINGVVKICQGAGTQLTDADAGGTWSSSNAGNATVSGAGFVSGVGGNTTATITYTLPTTCNSTAVVTVDPSPEAIDGTLALCRGEVTQLINPVAGGTWSSSNSNAIVGSAGLINGVTAGTAIISYTLASGCGATAVLTVNADPGAINGTLSVCESATTQLTDAGAGNWASSNTANVSISASGLASGIIGGTTAIVTYTLPTGCSITAIVTVNPLPASITGTAGVCQGATIQLSDAGFGTWSADGINASVNSTGLVTGLTGGNTAIITYALPSGCAATTAVTVYSLPAPISGAVGVCVGTTITLSDADAGTWSGSNANATIDGSGNVTGLSSGSVVVTYATGNGCTANAALSVYSAANPISGIATVCEGGTTVLSDAGGGSWNSNNGNVSVNISGVTTGVSAGTSIITYTLPVGGCYTTRVVTINPLPSPIIGASTVSVGYTTQLSDASSGIWAVNNANATIDASGLVTGVSAGTSIISYTLSTGCYVTHTITIVATPPAITGELTVCAGSATVLSDPGSGTWSSSNVNTSVGSATGIVTGISAGTSIITFSFTGGGEVYATVTVNPLPLAITGPDSVCQGSPITLTDASGAGSWSTTANAVIGSTGVVTGINPGTATVTFAFNTTGCSVSKVITINALPESISGSNRLCVASTISLTGLPGSGIWAASNTNATIGSLSGLVSGVSPGSTTITYTSASGCFITKGISVDALPGPITGTANICVGQSITLSDAGSGSWSSSNGNVTIDMETGHAVGMSAGTSVISYILSTGCFTTEVVTANAAVMPSVTISKTSADTVCSGTSVVFTATPLNGGALPVYEWSLNGSIIGGATSDIYSVVPSDGVNIITVGLISNAACAMPSMVSATDTFIVIHTDTSAISISVSPNDTVCLGSFALFTALGSNAGSSPVYTWLVNGAQVATGVAYGYVPGNGDEVYCTVASSLRCVAADTVASNHITMSVDTSYIPTVEINVVPGTSVSSTQPVTFNALVSNAGPLVSYQWFINTEPITGATSSAFTHAYFANNDSVSCAVVSVGPCGYASFNAVKMHVIRTDVEQVINGANDIRLIPNPNKGQFNIKGMLQSKSNEDVFIDVTDMLGQVVFKSTARSIDGNLEEQISLRDGIANGMYLLNLRIGSERVVFHFVVGQ